MSHRKATGISRAKVHLREWRSLVNDSPSPSDRLEHMKGSSVKVEGNNRTLTTCMRQPRERHAERGKRVRADRCSYDTGSAAAVNEALFFNLLVDEEHGEKTAGGAKNVCLLLYLHID